MSDELVKEVDSTAEVRRVAKLVAETQPIWAAHLRRVCDDAEYATQWKQLFYETSQALIAAKQAMSDVASNLITNSRPMDATETRAADAAYKAMLAAAPPASKVTKE